MTRRDRLKIGVDFDLVCPWCFIGLRQLQQARAQFGAAHPQVAVDTAWYPLQLLPDVPEEGVPFAHFYERRLGSPEAVRRRREQVATAARAVGLELDLRAIARMPNTARAHRLLRRVARLGRPTLYESLLERLFVGYFQRGEDIGDAVTLGRLALEVGTPAESIADERSPGQLSTPGHAADGVPHFLFNGLVSLSGAHPASALLAAMRQAVAKPRAADDVPHAAEFA